MMPAIIARATGTETPTAIPMVLPELDDFPPSSEILDELALALEVLELDPEADVVLEQSEHYQTEGRKKTCPETLLVELIPAATARTLTAFIIPSGE
jgi:hypothetical protein